MPIRIRPALAAVGTCLLAISGCASVTAGSGSGSGAPITSAPPSTSSAPSTSSPPPSTSSAAPSPSSSSSSAPSGGCGGAFCDDFSSASTGWDVGNEKHFYSEYSKYQGGTFRMGERHNAILTVPAPYDITKAAHDFSVQLDADAILGSTSPKDAVYGLSCWNHEAHNKSTAAFLFYFTRSGAQIVLWDNRDGSVHVLRRLSWSGVLRPAPARNHIRALCLQRTHNGTAVAELGMDVNGHVLTKIYRKGGSSQPWATGDRVGLIVGLTGADVFYDNFEITGECKGSYC
jgi:hypothetical protein